MVSYGWTVHLCRFVLGILAWTWAICVFLVHYCGSELEQNQPAVLRQFVIPIFKVILVAPASLSVASAQGPGSVGHHGSVQAGSVLGPLTRSAGGGGIMQAAHVRMPYSGSGGYSNANEPDLNLPASQQHMSLGADGQYSFGYSAPTSSRQERRNQDGFVEGSYSYTDPEGKLVRIEYTADASGYNAYGENVPPRQIALAPFPVQDTPDVAEARAKFLEYYQQEWNARKALEAKENATASPLSPTSIPVVTLPDTAITVNNGEAQGSYDEAGDEDSEIVSGFDEPSEGNGNLEPSTNSAGQSDGQQQQQQQQQSNSPLYTLQYEVGNKPHPGQSQNQYSASSRPVGGSSPGYFYYVGVGGLPYYITAVPTNTKVAVSVRAAQLGAIPVAAVHDVQTPHGDALLLAKQSPPVYVEVGSDYNEVGKTPIAAVGPGHFRQVPPSAHHQNKQPGASSKYPVNFPYHGRPVVVY